MGFNFSDLNLKSQRIKSAFASQHLLWRGFPSHSQHLHNMSLAPPAVQEKTGRVSGIYSGAIPGTAAGWKIG